MATLVEDLVALLSTLAPAGGVWYGANTNTPPTYPYIVVQRVASEANVALGGPSLMQNTRVQVDIYARSVAESVSIESALEALFAGWSVQNVPLLSQDYFDEEVRAYRVSKDYSVWATN